MQRRGVFIFALALVVVGAAVAIIIAVSATSGDDASNGGGAGAGGDPNKPVDDSEILDGTSNLGSMPESNPETATAALTMLAIGDWGATTYKEGSCCNKYRKNKDKTSVDYQRDYHAQVTIATLMSQSAAQLKPRVILGHGDNVYWNGVGPGDATARMATTFDDVYNQASLKGIPWINVAGNHDIGGSMYLCGPGDNQFVPCKSTAELLQGLDNHFDLMAEYKSPDNNRWIMKSHYYKESVTQNGVSVDIFNIDTNYADSHAAHQVCCQCYGYSQGSTTFECNNVQKGDAFCAGGNIGMYEACMAHIKEWWDDSIVSIKRDLAASTATWKVINTHYSPHFHMGEDKMKTWYLICKQYGVHIWFNGHTHGFNHDISKWNTHFFENGGGGGIQSETSGNRPEQAAAFVDTQWIGAGAPYGFFELTFSEDWIKAQFVTFDDDWKFSLTIADIVPGGIKRDHCWHIPRTGKPGKACTAP